MPPATGGSGIDLSYTLTGPPADPSDSNAIPGSLPTGLIFGDTTRTLTGTPQNAGTVALTYTATDSTGSAMVNFDVTITGPSLATPDPQSFGARTIIVTPVVLPAAVSSAATATEPLIYSLIGLGGDATTVDTSDDNLPSGLVFDSAADSRELSGTPSTVAAAVTLTYRVTDRFGNTAFVEFTVTITGPVFADLTSLIGRTYAVNQPIAMLTLPAATGNGGISYALGGENGDSLADSVPGLSFNPAADSRELSGEPTAVAPAVTLIYTATDTDGSATATFEVTIVDGLVIAAISPPSDYPAGAEITALILPPATGGSGIDLSYTLTGPPVDPSDSNAIPGPLPAGLIFEDATQTLTGTPQNAGTVALTYTATDSTSSAVAYFDVTITGPSLATPDPQSFGARKTIANPLVLPAAVSSAATVAEPLIYSLIGADGDASTVDTLDDNLPDGLVFDPAADSRELSGTPSMVAEAVDLTYRVTDRFGNTAFVEFAVTITGPVFADLTSLIGRTYAVNQPITMLVLPTASGNGGISYALAGANGDSLAVAVPGLSFNPAADSRELSGQPTAVAPAVTLIYTATDTDGSATATFEVTIVDGLVIAAISPPPDYPAGADITALILPAATGGSGIDLSYTLTGPPVDPSDSNAIPGPLPAGLIFEDATQTLTGTPQNAGTVALTYTATDSTSSAVAYFDVTITGPSLATPDPQSFGARKTIANPLVLPAAVSSAATATEPLVYSLIGADGDASTVDTSDDNLPDGLVFDPAADSRELSGTPSTVAAAVTLTYRVTDRFGNTAFVEFAVTITGPVFADLTSLIGRTYAVNQPIAMLTLPAATGNGGISYALAGENGDTLAVAVPGLSFNPAADSRELSGQPTAVAPAVTLIYTATDADGSATATFDVTIVDGLVIAAIPTPPDYPAGAEITALILPAATGGSGIDLSYTLTGPPADPSDSNAIPGPLPTGLIFDDATQTLTGTPQNAGTVALTYTATDSTSSATVNFDVTITGPSLATPDPQSFGARTLIVTPVVLPAAVSSAATVAEPLVYSLIGLGGDADTVDTSDDNLPDGLVFDADSATRTLTGTPSTVAEAVDLTYRVTDRFGNTAFVEFTITITGPVFADLTSLTGRTYAVNQPIAMLVLPTATGNGVVSYTLAGENGDTLAVAVPGLSFNPAADSRELSGQPTAVAPAVTLVYTATDTDGSATATFEVTIVDGLVIVAIPTPPDYPAGAEITALILPPATSGSGIDLSYTLTGPADPATPAIPGPLPTGLIFDDATQTLTGTPQNAGTVALTYTATDSTASVTAEFAVTITGPSLATPDPQSFGARTLIVTPVVLPAAVSSAATVAEPLIYSLIGADGDASTVDTLDDNLPDGLVFDPAADSRELSGTPSMVAEAVDLTYRVTDRFGNTAFVEFAVTITGPVFADLTSLIGRTYAVNQPITMLVLPTASGNGGISYALAGANGDSLAVAVPGLSFNPAADSRELSGEPTAVAPAVTLVYTATDADGSATATFDVTIVDGLVIAAIPTPPDYPAGAEITALILPAATGGSGIDLSYTLTGPPADPSDSNAIPGPLPTGLIFDDATQTLTGTPQNAGTVALTYTATDSTGSAVVNFDVTITGPSLATPDPQSFGARTLIVTPVVLPAAVSSAATVAEPLIYSLIGADGDASTVDTLDDNLPDGLIFDPAADSRELSGTPSTVAAAVDLTYRVTDRFGNTAFVEFTVTITGPVFAAADLTSLIGRTYAVNQPIAMLTLPAATGNGGISYALAGENGDSLADSVPGLSFNPAADSRELSGQPTAVAPAVTLVYTATDDDGSATATFEVTIADGLIFPADQPADLTLPAGTALTVADSNAVTLPAVTGNIGADDAVVYALVEINDTTERDTDPATDNLPTGLAFDPATRVLTGTPQYVDEATLSYTATDGGFSTLTAEFAVTITGPSITSPGEQSFDAGDAMTTLILPAATGMATPLTYSLVGPGGNADTVDTSDDNLPDGLVFDADSATRTLTGTPSTVAEVVDLTYRVTDRFGNTAFVEFAVTITGPSITARGDREYGAGSPIERLTLPAATGMAAPLTYSLIGADGDASTVDTADDNLPDGLVFDPAADSRELSGTPSTVAAAVTLTYRVTDRFGNTAFVEFAVTITGPVFAAADLTSLIGRTYAVNQPIATLVLPTATGNGVVSYTLAGENGDTLAVAVPGLSFNAAANSRELSGEPTAVAPAVTLVYTATDDDGSATATFEVTIADGLIFPADQPADLTLPAGTALTVAAGNAVTLPAVTGNIGADDDVVYALVEISDTTERDTDPATDNLPTGLTFDPATRVLTGTPQYVDVATLAYTATDDGFSTLTAEFTITITGPSITSPGDKTYPVDSAIATLILPAATGMAAPLTYSLVGPGGDADTVDTSDDNLPDGLVFDPAAAARTLTGEPTAIAATLLDYTVTDRFGNVATVMFTVSVTRLAFVGGAPGDETFAAGTALTVAAGNAVTLPAVTGNIGADDDVVYALVETSDSTDRDTDTAVDNLPTGLSFDPATRVLTGTPEFVDVATLAYTATDGGFSTLTADFTVTITGPSITSPGDKTYPVDSAIATLILPAATGMATPLTYSLVGPGGDADTVDTSDDNLPDGLVFDPAAAARTLTGEPTAIAATLLDYTVTDRFGNTATVMFTVSVTQLAFVGGAPGDETFAAGTALTVAAGNAVTLPAVTGNIGADDDVVYALVETGDTTDKDTDPAVDNLPTGLSFDPATRVLTGTPQYVDVATLSYTATDGGFSTLMADFTVTITGPRFADFNVGEQSYSAGMSIDDLPLPEATDGFGAFTYTLTGPNEQPITEAVLGLMFDGAAASRTLSGMPSVAGQVMLTYIATDESDNATDGTAIFMVTVHHVLPAPDPVSQSFSAGSVVSLALPAAIGGGAAFVYGLTAAAGSVFPAGLVFTDTATARVLSGVPTTVTTSPVTLVYTADRGSGDDAISLTATFEVTITAAADETFDIDDQEYAAGTALTADTSLTLPQIAIPEPEVRYALDGTYGATGDALPGGFSFDENSRVLSGEPTVAGAFPVTYTARRSGVLIASGDFTITVTHVLETPGDETYAVGGAVNLTLPTALGDPDGVLVYALSNADAGTENLPAGLLFAAGARVLSGTPSAAGEFSLAYTARQAETDGGAGGIIATMQFVVTITGPRFVNFEENDRNYLADEMIDNLTLPMATDGFGTFTYTLTGPDGETVAELFTGLSFDGAADSRILSGTPTAAAAVTLTYIATDSATPPNATDGLAIFMVSVGQREFARTIPPQSYPAGDSIEPLTLPAIVGGGDLTYAVTGPGNAAVGDAVPGLAFDADSRILSGVPRAAAAAVTLTYTAGPVGIDDIQVATVQFTVTISAHVFTEQEIATAVNMVVLPEVTRAIAGNVTAAITQRIGRAGAGSVGPSISLGGQGSVAGVLGAHGQAMAEDSRATKALLAGSEFTLPLNASGDGGGAASTTLWGSGEYRKMSGTGDGLDWDGELSGFHIGVDTRPRPGLLLGLSVSKLRSEVDYSGDLGGGIGTSAGRQDLDLTSLHPYLGWRAGTLDLWASLGYGEGNIAIDPHDSARVSGDVDMRAVGFGGSGALWAGGGGALRLRGEISGSRLQVARNADLDALEISTMRVRLAAEASHRRTLVGGGVFEPAVELGLRQDSGDGAGGAAAEFGARMGYSNAATGYRAEGSFRAVLAPSEYEEWGVHGSVSFAAGADGQGLSLLISPAYGQIASGIEKLWQHGLPAADNAAADDYRARLEAHLGYGLPLKNHGVLTPYGELTVGASRRHRLGLNWRPSRHFELNLLGERRQSSDGPAENAVPFGFWLLAFGF